MIIGHSFQWQFLKKLAQTKKIPHAFLFCGKESLGKKRVALEFAKLLNCQDSHFSNKPCNRCDFCKLIEEFSHPDVLLIGENNKEISISEVKAMQQNFSFTPTLSDYKIAILDNCENLTLPAQNALLKILEEPLPNRILILISSKPELLLPTVRSRLFSLKFYPVSFRELYNFVEKKKNNHLSKKIVFLANGAPGRLITYLGNLELLKKEEKIFKFWEKILKEGFYQRMIFLKKFFQEEKELEKDLHYMIDCLLRYLRELILDQVQKNDLKKIYQLMKTIKKVSKFQKVIQFTNVNYKLLLENLLLSI